MWYVQRKSGPMLINLASCLFLLWRRSCTRQLCAICTRASLRILQLLDPHMCKGVLHSHALSLIRNEAPAYKVLSFGSTSRRPHLMRPVYLRDAQPSSDLVHARVTDVVLTRLVIEDRIVKREGAGEDNVENHTDCPHVSRWPSIPSIRLRSDILVSTKYMERPIPRSIQLASIEIDDLARTLQVCTY